MKNIVLVVGALFLLTGCAVTSGNKQKTDDLNNRIQVLENDLRQKESDAAKLQEEVNKLNAQIAGKTKPANRPAAGVSMATAGEDPLGIIRVNVNVADVQTALKNAGLYTGNIDGKIGQQTMKALAEFQKANGLTPDSILGKKTWDKLSTFLVAN